MHFRDFFFRTYNAFGEFFGTIPALNPAFLQTRTLTHTQKPEKQTAVKLGISTVSVLFESGVAFG